MSAWEKGCKVQVRAFGCWYPGKVVSVGPKLIKVEFTTGGFGGNTKTRTFLPSYVAPYGAFTECRRGEAGPGSPEYVSRLTWLHQLRGESVSR